MTSFDVLPHPPRPDPTACEADTLFPFRRTATRSDLLDAVATQCPTLSRPEIRALFETALGEIAAALARGEHVKLRSFGHFNVRAKRQRIGRNPRTGAEVPITPRRVLTFKPSPVLVEEVNAGIRRGASRRRASEARLRGAV